MAALKEAAESLENTDGVLEAEAMIIRDVVEQIFDLNARINRTDAQIAVMLEEFEPAQRLMQMPGISRRIAAIIIAEVGDVRNFENEGKLATFAGLTPICRQSGASKGINRLARQTNKHLLWAMYLAALVSVRCYGPSRRYYDRKLEHTPGAYADKIRAAIALARQRCKIIYKILSREGFVYRLEHDEHSDAKDAKLDQGTKTVNRSHDLKRVRESRPCVTVQHASEIALLLQQGTTPLPSTNSFWDTDMTN